MTTNQVPFHDQASLSKTAEALGKEALKLGLISSFVVRYFPDSQQFYIPDENQSEPLTPERAYLYLRGLVERSNKG